MIAKKFNYPVSKALKLAFELPPKLTPVQFIEKYCRLPRQVSNERPGQIRLDMWQRQILDDCGNRKVIQRNLQSCTQIGKTTLLTVLVMWALFYKERNCIIVFPTEHLAEEFFKKSIIGVIRESPYFAKYLGERSDTTNNVLILKNGVSARAVWPTAANLAGNPASVVIIDEVDKLGVMTGKESDPISLAEARMGMAMRSGALLFCASTPTGDQGWIAKLNSESILNHWTFDCPACKVKHPVDFYNLIWPGGKDAKVSDLEKDPSLIQWKCPDCKELLPENKFRVAVKKGRWEIVPNQDLENKSQARIGYKLNGIMSEYKSWLYIVTKFLKMGSDDAKQMEFRNSILGEIFEDKAVVNDDKSMEECIDDKLDFNFMQCPSDTIDIVAGIDVRGDLDKVKDHYYHCIVTAIQPGDRYTVIGAGYFESSEGLIRFLHETYNTENGEELGVSQAFIDSGYQAPSIYKLCIQNPALKPCKGQKNCSKTVWVSYPDSMKNFDGSLREQAKSLALFNVNGHFFKDIISDKIKSGTKTLKFVKNLPAEVFTHLQGEKRISKLVNGFYQQVWTQRWPGKNTKGMSENHYLDSLVYSLALWWYKDDNKDLNMASGGFDPEATKPTEPEDFPN